jgi:methyl-accepting chemotaxis protein
MEALAHGDLFRGSPVLSGVLQQLKSNTNMTADKLATIVGETVDGMAAIKTATGQLSSGSTDLSAHRRAGRSLQQMAAAIRELSVTVKGNAENAQQANQLALAARASAEGSGSVAREATEAMGRIEQSSQRIGEIVGLIEEIAFQTNLLALNAAVEAARAGDAGRGLAAGPVRALRNAPARPPRKSRRPLPRAAIKLAKASPWSMRGGSRPTSSLR